MLRKLIQSDKQKINVESEDSTPIYKMTVDSPNMERLFDRNLDVHGWLITNDGYSIRSLRLVNNTTTYDLNYNIERPDVYHAFHDQGERALKSGFELQGLEVEGGSLTIEADFGQGYVKVFESSIEFTTDRQFKDYYNKDLAVNYAEHQVLQDNKKKYFYEQANDKYFIRSQNDPRLVALYLPQFHPIKYNDITWGKGFTEWSNVASAVPRFIGHDQPKLPADLGFYDLRLENNVQNQIELAKKHGIYGFCFYYYWFSGEKILDTPLNIFMKHKEWDFNFMICWANENWTKRWDGRDNDVIIAQKYLKTDPLDFIKDVEPILLDPRYIRNNGKPLLVVYRGSELKNTPHYIEIWRQYFREKHGLELEILTMLNFDQSNPQQNGFDAGIEFEPLTTNKYMHEISHTKKTVRYTDFSRRKLDTAFNNEPVHYVDILKSFREKTDRFTFPTYKSVAPSWDNDPRKKGKGGVFYGANPLLYSVWLDEILRIETKTQNNPLIFINAWNEWAEGAILEPTQQYGHAVLNKTTEILSKYSANKLNKQNFPLYGIRKKRNAKLAIHIHAYYLDELDYICKKLTLLRGNSYDIFITTREEFVRVISEKIPKANILAVPNRGRDILPFLVVSQYLAAAGYTQILKLHTKKSEHRKKRDGDKWFTSVIDELLPSEIRIKEVIQKLNEEENAFIGPKSHLVSIESFMGSNDDYVNKLMNDLDIHFNLGQAGFFAGSMFWCNLKAIKPFIDRCFSVEDFESEKGQIDNTLAHAIERTIGISAQIIGSMITISSKGIREVKRSDIKKHYKHAASTKPKNKEP